MITLQSSYDRNTVDGFQHQIIHQPVSLAVERKLSSLLSPLLTFHALKTKNLTLYHTIPTFNDPKEEGFGKHRGERRKCWSDLIGNRDNM